MFLAEQRKQPGVPVVPSLRLLAGGGAPRPPELYHAVVREMGVQLTHGYGMTEVPMITMGAPDDTAEMLATTEGRPPEGMEIRIVDGEVRLRGRPCAGATWTRHRPPKPSTRRGSCAPGTSGG